MGGFELGQLLPGSYVVSTQGALMLNGKLYSDVALVARRVVNISDRNVENLVLEPGPIGQGPFLGQGMVAWMQACSWVASTTADNLRRCPTIAGPLPDDLRGEIVLVLAAMALNQPPEVRL